MRPRHLLVTTTLPLLLACSAGSAEEEPTERTSSAATGAITEVKAFGPNPGALKMFEHVPAKLAAKPGLVLVLHGCTQGAADATAFGWNELSDELGFVVVYPEQTTANNPLRCFNWAGEYGDPANLQRGKGENQSLKSMVDKAVADHGVDPAKVFVVGFSAGAATALVAAATWPDVFAGAASIAGVPFHCTTVYAEVSSCQKPGKDKTPAQWGDLVRAAHAGHAGPWPRVSVWQGSADTIVGTANRKEIVEQWTNVHGLSASPSGTETVDGQARSVWKDAKGTPVVETYEIAAMGHGVPVVPSKQCGAVGAYAVDKGICAARRVAEFFGLTATGSGADAGSSGGASSGGASPGGASSGGGSGAAGGDAGLASSSGGGGAGEAADDASGSYKSTCALGPATRAPAGGGLAFVALALAAFTRRKGGRS